eukprot:jgi/Mesvir1/12488/Mv10244-RA.1
MATDTVYVSGLPPGTSAEDLAEIFGSVGLLKTDKSTGAPKIWLYRDKETGEPKGDATVSYVDPPAAAAAVQFFNNAAFHGGTLHVSLAQKKDAPGALPAAPPAPSPAGQPPKPDWQGEGDWPCPNESCNNVNFAFRGQCNRCGTPRPDNAGGGAGAGRGAGRGRGRGRGDAPGAGRGRGSGGPPGLFGPNDWNCSMCGNTNWAKRDKCNICNTPRPGTVVDHREGRGGGFKELDEMELEEARKRRRAYDDDDDCMYDDFGNLKKKFRAKHKQLAAATGDDAAAGGGDRDGTPNSAGVRSGDGGAENVSGRPGGDARDWDAGELVVMAAKAGGIGGTMAAVGGASLAGTRLVCANAIGDVGGQALIPL